MALAAVQRRRAADILQSAWPHGRSTVQATRRTVLILAMFALRLRKQAA